MKRSRSRAKRNVPPLPPQKPPGPIRQWLHSADGPVVIKCLSPRCADCPAGPCPRGGRWLYNSHDDYFVFICPSCCLRTVVELIAQISLLADDGPARLRDVERN
jgi:hypothetical protein